jgi:hypothetical protein
MHPSTGDGVSDGSVGKVLLVAPEANEIPVALGTIDGGFRWYEDDSGDVADEILAWAAAEETRHSPPGTPVDQGPLAGRLPA